jgi:carnitine 3-dehydrogenase
MYHGQTGALIATTEQMLLHVDMKAAKTAPIVPRAHEALSNVWAMHRDLPAPEQAGRRMSLEAKG